MSKDSKVAKRSCLSCGANTYKTGLNRGTKCTDQPFCGKGKYITADSKKAARACKPCGPNTYRPSSKHRAMVCAPQPKCPAGQRMSKDSKVAKRSCLSCGANTYKTGLNRGTKCTTQPTCGAGTKYVYSATAKRTCVDCAGNAFQSSTAHRSASCTKVSAPCAAGLYMDAAMTSISDRTCDTCAAGYFKAIAGNVDCEKWRLCPKGEGKSQEGTTKANRKCAECDPVGKNHFPRTIGGTFSDTVSGDPCEDLLVCQGNEYETGAPSRFEDRDCATHSKKCPGGQWTFKGPTAHRDRICHKILTCTPGRYQTVNFGPSSNRECKDCASGKYQPGQNQLKCTGCAPGKHRNASPASSVENVACTNCVPGKITNSWARLTCWKCNAGRSQPSHGQTGCEACATGTYQDKKGMPTCVDCAAGKFRNTAAASSTQEKACTACDIAEYQDQPAQTKCLACAAGKFRNEEQFAASKPEAVACKTLRECPLNTDAHGPGLWTSTKKTAIRDRICSDLRMCKYDEEWEHKAPSQFENRVCRKLTLCPLNEVLHGTGQWTSTKKTLTSNRKCSALRMCDYVNQWEETKPAQFANRVCTPLTTCKTTEWETPEDRDQRDSGALNLEDRICTPHTVAKVTEFETKAAGTHNDRTVQAHKICAKAEWEVKYEGTHHDRVCEIRQPCRHTKCHLHKGMIRVKHHKKDHESGFTHHHCKFRKEVNDCRCMCNNAAIDEQFAWLGKKRFFWRKSTKKVPIKSNGCASELYSPSGADKPSTQTLCRAYSLGNEITIADGADFQSTSTGGVGSAIVVFGNDRLSWMGASTQCVLGNDSVDINAASAADLDRLFGIGASYAQRIIDHRESNGAFSAIEDLSQVSGISANSVQKMLAKAGGKYAKPIALANPVLTDAIVYTCVEAQCAHPKCCDCGNDMCSKGHGSASCAKADMPRALPVQVKGYAKNVWINDATEQELDTLYGIGPATAKLIIEYRKANGSFDTIEDLAKVKGISLGSVKRMLEHAGPKYTKPHAAAAEAERVYINK
jgi:competence ComEA-like helix-hairpin-helix protein